MEGGYTCALDLVKHIRQNYDDFFCIAVSGMGSLRAGYQHQRSSPGLTPGYPEGHPTAITKVEDEAALTEAEKVRWLSWWLDRGCREVVTMLNILYV